MKYMVDLDAFHGPLDLLLYLIDKNEIDIYDIPIADITAQYMEHLQQTGDFTLDRLGDFLSMASYLLNLKSRMLLPANDEEEIEEDVSDPREELVKKLLDYRRYKKAAQYLQARQTGDFNRVFYRASEGEISINEEIRADLSALIRAYHRVYKSIPEVQEPILIPEGDINVEEKMEEILERLRLSKQGIYFHELFVGVKRKREVLVLFLALLELIRLQQVVAAQQSRFADIEVYLRVAI